MVLNKRYLVAVLLFMVTMVFSGGVSWGSEKTTSLVNPVKSNSESNKSIPDFELPMPESEKEKSYLGLSGTGHFKLGQIKAPVLIVEIFSFYCPHCQRTASQVNDLYHMIQNNPDVREKIKMIGIGVTNSSFEVNSYRDKYEVPFPLFPDQNMKISEKFNVRGTPTFIGLKVNPKGSHEQVYFGEGGFEDNQQFLNEIIKRSGLK